jgi:hypothetical protein
MVTSVTKGGTQKLSKIFKIDETYWHDYSLESSWRKLEELRNILNFPFGSIFKHPVQTSKMIIHVSNSLALTVWMDELQSVYSMNNNDNTVIMYVNCKSLWSFRASSSSGSEAQASPSKEALDNEFAFVKLEDLDVVATLGMGGFGRVELVRLLNQPL